MTVSYNSEQLVVLACDHCAKLTDQSSSVRSADSSYCCCMECMSEHLPRFYVEALEAGLFDNSYLH